MSVRIVQMYRVECDATGCDKSPMDGSDFYAYDDEDGAVTEARDQGWWISDDETVQFCDDHAPPYCDECGDRHKDGRCPEATR